MEPPEKKANKAKQKTSSNGEDPITDGDDDTPFKDLSCSEKLESVGIVAVKISCFLTCLYVFICSLGLLESAFQLLGARFSMTWVVILKRAEEVKTPKLEFSCKSAGKAFSSGLLSDPFAGLMIGVLATVLMQSSSTSTSIVVTMVGSDVLSVEKAVPIIMGANIGTSVTNTLVSLAQAGDRAQFKRSFSGATVHDMFNWLSVIILLPIEMACGYLSELSKLLVDSMGLDGNNEKTPDMLKALTKPVLDSIVKVNKDIIKEVAIDSNKTDDTVLRRWCQVENVLVNKTIHNEDVEYINCTDVLLRDSSPLHIACRGIVGNGRNDPQNVSINFDWDSVVEEMEKHNLERCDALFSQTDLSDLAAGIIILIVSLILMLSALMLIVKILNSMLNGSVTKVIKKTINADLPGRFAYFTGYIAILVGVGMTIIVQSSSIFTSTLTPLVGLGIVDIERMYPMTLGSNIGTTVTAILAALSQSGDKLKDSLRIALCHLFFNISGLLLYYPIPFMRFPIGMAKVLGKTTSKHRWFAIFYIVIMFVLLPGCVFGLSYAGYLYLGAIGGPLLFIFLGIVIINALQTKRPKFLPKKLRNWDFLPHWMHSLKPVDALIAKVFRCAYCQKLQKLSDDEELLDVEGDCGSGVGDRDNPGFELDQDIETGPNVNDGKTDSNGGLNKLNGSKSTLNGLDQTQKESNTNL